MNQYSEAHGKDKEEEKVGLLWTCHQNILLNCSKLKKFSPMLVVLYYPNHSQLLLLRPQMHQLFAIHLVSYVLFFVLIAAVLF